MWKKIVAVLVAAIALSMVAAAQETDVYWVGYFNNRNNVTGADQFVYLVNAGAQGTPLSAGEGTLCANIYVLDTIQELVECCSCPVTANALVPLSVNNNLTANPLTTFPPNGGVIKVVSSQPNGTACDPTALVTATMGNPNVPTPDLRAWGTHLQAVTAGSFLTTEAPFLAAPLSNSVGTGELTFLPQACTFGWYLGTGTAVCSCK
jgi:hypothetical protein